jgi:hypothetical protein
MVSVREMSLIISSQMSPRSADETRDQSSATTQISAVGMDEASLLHKTNVRTEGDRNERLCTIHTMQRLTMTVSTEER